MSKQPPPAPTTSAVGPCPTVIQIVGRPGTGSLPSTIAPPDHPLGTVGQGPIVLAVGAGGGCLDIFTLIYPFSPLSPSLWETARYRLIYYLKGPLNPKQPTNHLYVLAGPFHLFSSSQLILLLFRDSRSVMAPVTFVFRKLSDDVSFVSV